MLDLIGGSYVELARQESSGGLPKLMLGMLPGGVMMIEAANLVRRTVERLDRGMAGSKRPWPTWLPYIETEEGDFALCEEPYAQVLPWRHDATTRDDKVAFDPLRPTVCIQLEPVHEALAQKDGQYADRFWVPLMPDSLADRPIPGLAPLTRIGSQARFVRTGQETAGLKLVSR
ncbi:MAG TPA: hypothetical protein VLF21_00385 [Candidatus Saccharimonadales bacterium]|nr:hypothetical protein [Candidatus Saccharimonadales bacterium]